MDVYLVPVAPDRYELYCEVEDVPQEPEAAAPVEPQRKWTPRAIYRRLTHAFREMLDEAERERRHGRADKPRGTLATVRARAMRWVAESIAEQRLLWHL